MVYFLLTNTEFYPWLHSPFLNLYLTVLSLFNETKYCEFLLPLFLSLLFVYRTYNTEILYVMLETKIYSVLFTSFSETNFIIELCLSLQYIWRCCPTIGFLCICSYVKMEITLKESIKHGFCRVLNRDSSYLKKYSVHLWISLKLVANSTKLLL